MTPLHQLGLWTLFYIGTALHILKRMSFAVRNPINPVRSRVNYLRTFWDVICIRTSAETFLFWAWLRDPALLSHAPQVAGLDITVNLPVTAANCVVLGFFGDSVLDWLINQFPRLREQLPLLTDDCGETSPAHHEKDTRP